VKAINEDQPLTLSMDTRVLPEIVTKLDAGLT